MAQVRTKSIFNASPGFSVGGSKIFHDMDKKEYMAKVDACRAEIFQLAQTGGELIKDIVTEKGRITEDILYDGEARNERDWIWLDYKWDDAATDICLLGVFKNNERLVVELLDINLDDPKVLSLDCLTPLDIVEIANQLCMIYDRL